MKQRLVLCLVLLVFIFSSLGSGVPLSVAKTFTQMPEPPNYGFFTENKGQWDPAILFVGNTSFGRVAFTKEAIYYQLAKQGEPSASQTIKLSFVNSLPPTIQGADLLPHYFNYFMGSDQSKWASHCRNFTRVTYEDVWVGIDLAYFFTPEGMKYEYYVEPSADLSNLKLQVDGATLSNLGKTLHLGTTIGTIQDTKLLVFDQKTKKSISSSFALQKDTFSFQGIPKKRENTIVIDPLVYSTYLGSNDADVANANAVDSLSNHYITGYTLSAFFPVVSGLYPAPGAGVQDAFVSKFDPSGNLLWSTYLGGGSIDTGKSIALDPLGTAVYITGDTSSGAPSPFPTTVGAFQTNIGTASTDCFFTKLNANGTTLLYSTFLGGIGYDSAEDIAVDAYGSAYITGYAGSLFPTTVGAYQTSNNGGEDCFITKLNPSGNGPLDMIYSTYIGGSTTERGHGITVNKLTGVAAITGRTSSNNYPSTVGAFKPSYLDTSTTDAFVTQINATGSALLYSTFLGGIGNEIGWGITQDLSGNFYVCGETDSAGVYPTGFPTTVGAFQTTYDNWTDAFVTKLTPGGNGISDMLYSTFLGGSNYDYAYAIAVDLAGYIYVTGETWSSVQTGTSFPLSLTADQSMYGGSTDAFVTKLLPAGGGASDLTYSSYLGGTNTDVGNCIAIDLTGNVYVVGQTLSTDFPTASPYQVSHDPVLANDCFVTKIGIISMVLTGAQVLGQVNLAWSIFNTSGFSISGYQVYRANVSDYIYSNIYNASLFTFLYPDSSGTVGQTYSYYVVAIDLLGNPVVTSNKVVIGPITGALSLSLSGTRNFDQVDLVWNVTNPGAIFIQGFQIFRAISGTVVFSPLAMVNGGNSRSYTDSTGIVGKTYDYYVVALNSGLLPIASSPSVTVGPIQAKPLPILNFSIILNKTEFEKGEAILLKVLIHNLSVSQATSVILTMTLPEAIDFTSVSGFAGTVSGKTVIFPIGNIPGSTYQEVNMICHVKGQVNTDTTSVISFFAVCAEGASTSDTANLILKARKTTTSSVSVTVTVQNTEQDPITGKRYITLGSPLIIEYEIEGGAFPYTLTIDWGDGTVETFVIKNMNDLKGVLQHIYASRGTFHVRLKIEDASGQSKNTDFDMEIR